MTTKLELDADALALFCARHHVRRLSLFGSVLKGTNTPGSDVDFLVEFETGQEPGLFALADMEAELSGMLGGRAVDLRTAQDLSRYFRDDVVQPPRCSMRSDDRVRLLHMRDAAEAVVEFVRGRGRADMDRDRMLLFAVVRAIEVIGEAAGRVSEDVRAAHPSIPWTAIVGMRNRLVHGYFDIDKSVVWRTATEEIPALLTNLDILLRLPNP